MHDCQQRPLPPQPTGKVRLPMAFCDLIFQLYCYLSPNLAMDITVHTGNYAMPPPTPTLQHHPLMIGQTPKVR
jgi:hypothetical protein